MEFFKETCGTLPTIMDCYNLQEVTTLIDLYSKIIIKFQEHSKVFQYQGKMNSHRNSFVFKFDEHHNHQHQEVNI